MATFTANFGMLKKPSHQNKNYSGSSYLLDPLLLASCHLSITTGGQHDNNDDNNTHRQWQYHCVTWVLERFTARRRFMTMVVFAVIAMTLLIVMLAAVGLPHWIKDSSLSVRLCCGTTDCLNTHHLTRRSSIGTVFHFLGHLFPHYFC